MEVFKEMDDFINAAAQIGYPVFIKPEISPLFTKIYKAKGFVANNREQLETYIPIIASSGIPSDRIALPL